MKKHILTSPKFSGEITFGYDYNGDLVFYNNATDDQTVTQWTNSYLPITAEALEVFKSKVKATIVEVPEDLSFDRFWEAYARKINRKRTEPLYNKLNEADKLAAIMNIKTYQDVCFAKRRGILDPENYIRNRAFDTNWKLI